MTKDEAKQKVSELVAKYGALSSAEVKKFNEANTKQTFMLPLFEALGWDIYDFNEVTLEEAASTKRVDFAFKLNNVARFYLEAKPLKADLNNPEYVKQAITYAYNNGVTWAVLTNFEELRLFNAQNNRPFIQLNCQDFITGFDKLWLLSRDAIATDALNKEATQSGALPPAIPIEERLFKQLRAWREKLFKELYHLSDITLKEKQIDEIIQKLFNRLIFIRTAEDRNLEEKQLRAAAHQHAHGLPLSRLQEIFQYYQGYYDSDQFETHLLDSDKLHIHEITLTEILNGLYEIPGGIADYDFSIIDADVLGRVYEQYLGYVASVVKEKAKEIQAKLDLGQKADTEFEITAKKQHRKEQGIYYTPQFVTNFIVKETVGRFIKENEAAGYDKILKMRILDPACGSGSFLIRAYDELLNYHARVRGKAATEMKQEDRMPILTGNIFGVDLDQQAVEIARLNLLLRGLAKRDHLPPLTDNIRQGNSLISGAEKELKGYFGKNWQDKHPFNWHDEFKDIMANGGFDVVIGNPPYVRIQSLPQDEADYYRSHYDSAFGSFDIYVLFIEKAIKLLKPSGQLGFITSGKFLKSDYGKKIQQLIHERCTVENIIDLSAQQIFAEATTYPVIIILRKGVEKKLLSYVFMPADSAQPPDISDVDPVKAMQEAIIKGIWPLSATDDKLLAKLSQNALPLADISERIFQGLVTSADKVYVLEKLAEAKNGKIHVRSKSLNTDLKLESVLLKPLISGKDIERFGVPTPNQLLLFPYIVVNNKAELISPSDFKADYPLCWQYLFDNRKMLENRENGKMKHENWYSYVYPKNLALHNRRKLAVPRLVDKLKAIYDREGDFYLDNVDVGGLILKENADNNYLYIMGLLNSRLIDYYFQRISVAFRGGFRSANRQYLEPLPIRQIDFTSLSEKQAHNGIVTLVEKMLALNKKLHPIKETYSNEREELVKQIEKTDKEIDDLVYDLYGLTESERKIVEANG